MGTLDKMFRTRNLLAFVALAACVSLALGGDSERDFVDDAIANNPVVVFSKSYCPYCRRAKGLLNELGAKAFVLELDIDPRGRSIQAYLQEKTGQRTVPNIVIGGKHIGGADSLTSLHASGNLQDMIDNAK